MAEHLTSRYRVIALDLRGHGDSPSQRNTELAERTRRRAVFPSRQEVFDAFHNRGMFKDWPDDALRLFIDHGTFLREDGQVELKCPPDIEAQFYLAPVEMDIMEAASHFTCPLLLAWSEGSDRFSPDLPLVAEFLQKTRCRTALVPGGHFMIMEYPREVAQVVLDFADLLAPPQ